MQLNEDPYTEARNYADLYKENQVSLAFMLGMDDPEKIKVIFDKLCILFINNYKFLLALMN